MLTEAYPRKATRADLLKLNPVIPAGDTVTEEDTGQMKVGNGRHRWSQLPYVTPRPLAKADIENLIYDKAYSWELQPGSDVMATTVGVLPKIGGAETVGLGDRFYYAGLVTIDHALASEEADGIYVEGRGYWFLTPASTTLSQGGFHGSDGVTVADPAGAYVAFYRTVPGTDTPPYAFPEGWTPGNTTGEGPVLPYLGTSSDGWHNYAGLVTIDPDGPVDLGGVNPYLNVNGYIFAIEPTTPLTAQSVYDAYQATSAGPVYLATFQVHPAGVAPTTLPAGWTFRPYGIGPVAITDENAGGLIGDVAYVVSGYVYNTNESGMLAIYEPRWIGLLPIGDHVVSVGDVFGSAQFPHDSKHVVTHAGTVTEAQGVSPTSSNGATWSSYETVAPSYWPFIERYDLAAKKWLPRIPMPLVDETHPYASEGGIAGVIDGKLYFGGGDGDNITGNEFFVYDPTDESITRLDDIIDFGTTADYHPYGVVGEALYVLVQSGTRVAKFTVEGGWVEIAVSGDINVIPGDQVQGFEISGKLWFMYDGVPFVFDPEALVVTAKTPNPFGTMFGGSNLPFLIDGKIWRFCNRFDQAGNRSSVYDPETDTWTELKNQVVEIQSSYDGEFAGVTYRGVPYLFSGVNSQIEDNNNMYTPGVVGMTGIALDEPRPARFQDVLTLAAVELDRPIPMVISVGEAVDSGSSLTFSARPHTKRDNREWYSTVDLELAAEDTAFSVGFLEPGTIVDFLGLRVHSLDGDNAGLDTLMYAIGIAAIPTPAESGVLYPMAGQYNLGPYSNNHFPAGKYRITLLTALRRQ